MINEAMFLFLFKSKYRVKLKGPTGLETLVICVLVVLNLSSLTLGEGSELSQNCDKGCYNGDCVRDLSRGKAEAEREAETLNVFSTQSTIDEQAKQIAKLNQELILKKKQWENDRNQFRDDKQRLYQTIDRVTDMQKKYQLETKASTKNENHYREKCVDDIDVINNLEGEVLVVKGKLEGNDEIIAD